MPQLRPEAQVPCPLTAGMKQAFLIHLEHTSHPRLSEGKSGSSFPSFRDVSGSPPSLENTRWDGWRQFCRKCCEIGFLSGLSSWKQSGQKALRSQPSFIACRATDGFPKHLKCVPLPWTEYAASCRKSFVCPQRNSDPVSFCLENESRRRRVERARRWGNECLMFETPWDWPAAQKGTSGDIYNLASCGHA